MLLTLSVNTHGRFLLDIKNELQLQMHFKKIIGESNRKPNKIRVDKGSKFYNRSMKFKKNEVEMYSDTKK